MTGKNTGWKKKKVPSCEPKLCPESFQNKRNEVPAENLGNQRVSSSLLAESCGERQGRMLPARFGNLCDFTERSEVRVTILDRGI